MHGGVLFHLLLVRLHLTLSLGQLVGLFSQLSHEAFTLFYLLCDSRLPHGALPAVSDRFRGAEVGAADGFVFASQGFDVRLMVAHRLVDLVKAQIDLRRRLGKAGVHRRAAFDGGVAEPLNAPHGLLDGAYEFAVVERGLKVHRSVLSF